MSKLRCLSFLSKFRINNSCFFDVNKLKFLSLSKMLFSPSFLMRSKGRRSVSIFKSRFNDRNRFKRGLFRFKLVGSEIIRVKVQDTGNNISFPEMEYINFLGWCSTKSASRKAVFTPMPDVAHFSLLLGSLLVRDGTIAFHSNFSLLCSGSFLSSHYTFSLYGLKEQNKFIISEKRLNVLYSKISSLKLPFVNMILECDDILSCTFNTRTHSGALTANFLLRGVSRRALSAEKKSAVSFSFLLCKKLFPLILEGKITNLPGFYCAGGRSRIKS